MVGDPGFFGSLFGGFKKVARVGLGFATGGVGGGIAGLRTGGSRTRPTFTPRGIAPPQSIAAQSFRQRPGLIPAVKTFFGGPSSIGPAGMPRRRRRMNAGNAKALRRAIRRTDAFVRLSRSALKNTGFKIVSKSAGKLTEAAWQKKAHHAK